MRIFFAIFILFIAPAAAQSLPEDKSAAVILSYQRIDEDNFTASSLRHETFAEHITEIVSGGYTALPLPRIIDAIKTASPLPDKTIAITFDGAFQSAATHAFPMLIENEIPFTILIPTAKPNAQNHISWKTLRSLARKHSFITLGIMGHDYTHLTALEAPEQKRQINKAKQVFKNEIGKEADIFSYPYGEVSKQIRSSLAAQNFTAALGLQSGVASPAADSLALPRFSMNDQYGSLGRFRLIANALPLPVNDSEPSDYRITQNTAIGFTLPEGLSAQIDAAPHSLSCFISGQSEKPVIEKLGTRVELRPKAQLTMARTRINCTIPESTKSANNATPRWRWLGMLLTPPLPQ